jgi:hypothetical protein
MVTALPLTAACRACCVYVVPTHLLLQTTSLVVLRLCQHLLCL